MKKIKDIWWEGDDLHVIDQEGNETKYTGAEIVSMDSSEWRTLQDGMITAKVNMDIRSVKE